MEVMMVEVPPEANYPPGIAYIADAQWSSKDELRIMQSQAGIARTCMKMNDPCLVWERRMC